MCGYVIGPEVGEFSKSYSSFIFEVEQNKNHSSLLLDPADKDYDPSQRRKDHSPNVTLFTTTTTAVNSLTACIFILELFPSSLAVPKFGAKSSVCA